MVLKYPDAFPVESGILVLMLLWRHNQCEMAAAEFTFNLLEQVVVKGVMLYVPVIPF